MKLLLRILVIFIVLVFTAVVFVSAYLAAHKPRYDGFLLTNGLVDSTEVIFDAYGIPHIYATNERDAYFALGFVHAQERLFQMEMLRRVASGRLAEVLGPELIDVDKFFRTLGIHKHSLESAERYLNDTTQPYAVASRAYTAGINAFIAQDRLPVEFRMAGIPATPFEPSDVYLATGFMAFSFAAAFRTDPLMSRIQKLGNAYLADLYIQHRQGTVTNPLNPPLPPQPEPTLTSINRLLEKLPVAPWHGSNASVIAPQKSATGKVMLANDTHIGYSQPAVMYEAHINYPGFNFFGFHLAGFPFAVIGRNDSVAWGLTMLKNDDM
ncbi:MAG TPA: penicillin acylase family protein, partial [Chitinophagales bacterium]|nr:penicillin acylase family protein [Chitinophagales bacterium]